MVWNDPLESGIFVFGQAVMSYRLLMTKDSHGKYTKRLKIIFILSISVDYMFWLEIMKSL